MQNRLYKPGTREQRFLAVVRSMPNQAVHRSEIARLMFGEHTDKMHQQSLWDNLRIIAASVRHSGLLASDEHLVTIRGFGYMLRSE